MTQTMTSQRLLLLLLPVLVVLVVVVVVVAAVVLSSKIDLAVLAPANPSVNTTSRRYSSSPESTAPYLYAYTPTTKVPLRLSYYAVRVVCGKRHTTVECPSVCPFVCPVDQQQHGLLLRSGAGSGHRWIAAAAAAGHAGRVNFGPSLRRSDILVHNWAWASLRSIDK